MSGPERMEKYDGREIFLPNIANLLAGDILLSRNAESESRKALLQSSTIRRFTSGSFSHAMICSDPPTFVEAVGRGVGTLSLGRCFAHSLDNIRVLRYPDAAVAAEAARIAQFAIGQEYSVRLAMFSIVPREIVEEVVDRGTFCSALVAQAFAAAGAPEFKATEAVKTTPATIEGLTILRDVTGSLFRPAISPSNIEHMNPLDGDAVDSPAAAQAKINNRYAAALRPFADQIASDYPEAGLKQPVTLFDIMEFITSAMDRTGRVDLRRQADYAAAVRVLDVEAAGLLNSGELSGLLDTIIGIDDARIFAIMTESFRPTPDIDIVSIRNYVATTIGGLDHRQGALDRLSAWGLHRSKALTAYVAIESRVIEPMKRRRHALEEILARIA